MVKLATSVLAVSLAALPALAAPSKQYERSVAESDLYSRDLANSDDIVVTREHLDELFGREFINDIEERSPFGLGMIFRGVKSAVKLGKDAAHHHSHHGHMPSFGGGSNNNNNNNNDRREFDEEEFDLRDFDEDLEAREPFGLGMIFRGVKAAVKLGKDAAHHSHHMPSIGGGSNNNNNNRREFDDEELSLRDFDEDLEAREPINLERLLHHARKAYSASQYIPQGGSDNNNNNRRDIEDDMFEREFDDEEFLSREYYDDLD